MRVDLYADGELGLWALDQIHPEDVGHLVTTDRRVEVRAHELSLDVIFAGSVDLNFDHQPVALSLHYHRIFSNCYILRHKKMYNIHPGFLPWGRGFYPVFWALWEQAPAGATLHEITPTIDGGPIVEQIRIDYSDQDTGGTLHRRVMQAEQELFRAYWRRLVAGEVLTASVQQRKEKHHTEKEFFALKRQADLAAFSARDLVRLVRAFSFPGYSGLEIRLENCSYELKITEVPKI